MKNILNSFQSIAHSLASKHLYSTLLAAALGLFVIGSPATFAEESESTYSDTSEEVISFVNINSADVATLTLLSGIGESKAQAIIEYRETLGKFENIEQLTEVKGIGARTVEKNRGVITL